MDALEPLAPFKKHSLYPQAVAAVNQVKREQGFNAARRKAKEISEAMTDSVLLAKLRRERKGA